MRTQTTRLQGLITIAALILGVAACSSNPHKAKRVETEIESHGEVTGDTTVGVKDGNMVVQKKVQMNEEVRRLQNEVFELEDRVYGNRKYGSLGLYGVLRQCKVDLSDPQWGGDGKLKWTEPIDRITDKEDEWKIGLDEKEKLVGVSEEFLLDRIQRFRNYKRVLMQRQDEYEEKVQICKAELKTQKAQHAQSKAAN
ncbi:MAG: hypothetical protein ACK5Y2_02680 [Bdellovibrionales bacterium]